MAKPLPDGAQPAPLGWIGEQDLGDGQADQLTVGQLGAAAGSQSSAEQVIDEAVQCDDEVVEIGVHEASLEVDVARATPTLGDLALSVTGNPLHQQSESIV